MRDQSISEDRSIYKILVLCDDQWHPREVLEAGLKGLTDRFSFYFMSTAKDMLLPEHLQKFDAVLLAKSNQISASNREPWFEEGVTETGPLEFKAYLESGGRMLVLHSGASYSEMLLVNHSDHFRKPDEEMRRLLGCEFVEHPPRCEVRIRIQKAHPVTEGVQDFCERDEHYQMKYMETGIEPLFYTESDSGRTMTGGYVRHIGKGRMVVLLPGHTLAMLRHAEYRKMISNALFWLCEA